MSPEEIISLRFRVVESNSVILIRPNGDVKFDCLAPFVIGNVREKNLADIWRDIGCNAWNHSRVREYVASLKKVEDMLVVHPRAHVDKDERLKVG